MKNGIFSAGLIFLACGSATAVPSRRAFLRAVPHLCPKCGSYIEAVAEQCIVKPRHFAKNMVAYRRIYFRGVTSRRQARRLARRYMTAEKTWYLFLTKGTAPKNMAFLKKVAGDRRIRGFIRCSSNWLLYFETNRVRYVVRAAELHPLDVQCFAYAKDAQFPLFLARLMAAVSPDRRHRVQGSRHAATALRYDYPELLAATYFQQSPDRLRQKLLGLYSRLRFSKRSSPGSVKRGGYSSLSPVRIIGRLKMIGRPAVVEFVRALARQGLELELSTIVRALPARAGLVEGVARQELAKTKSARVRKALTAFLKHPLARSSVNYGKHLMPPPHTPPPAHGRPRANATWLRPNTKSMTVTVRRRQRHAVAV